MIRFASVLVVLSGCGTPSVAEMHEDAAMRGRTVDLYTTRPDYRRCVSPLCGGDWLKAVNAADTRCKVGGSQDECYVAEMDLSGTANPDAAAGASHLLVAGRLGASRFDGFGRLGTFAASDAWIAVDDGAFQGTIHGVSDNGIRCFTTPCFSTDLVVAGSGETQSVSGLDVSALDLDAAESDALWRAYSDGTLFVSGVIRLGEADRTLIADEAWVPAL